MRLHGLHIVAGLDSFAKQQTFHARNPADGELLSPGFREADAATVERAATLAAAVFPQFSETGPRQRRQLLNHIAVELERIGVQLCERGNQETGLPVPRLEGELGRTVKQLRMFAQLVGGGNEKLPVVETALPERQPLPRPDLRLTQIPIGPVAVFGAGNFPLAFSVAGGDTAAALAAGCPVIVKGHPAHPGTSELAGRAIVSALKKTGLPAEIFALVQGRGHEVGRLLVSHPLVKAVAFTGSLAGGRALFDLAGQRREPIPVFAEMGSVNPVFILPAALAKTSGALARRYADSLTLGVGQFCTNPGLLVARKGPQLDGFLAQVNAALGAMSPLPMLHIGIKDNYVAGLKTLAALPGVDLLFGSDQPSPGCLALPTLLVQPAADFLAARQAGEEVFGPSSLVVCCDDFAQMLEVAAALPGQLTATVHALDEEENQAGRLFRSLRLKAGRLILNQFPTGVEVCAAMHHGGPYPATTDSRFSSVGTTAIRRFLRPVCYQNFTAALLPDELKPEAGED